MRITSLGIINNLSANNAKIINVLDFDSKKLSIVEINNNKTHVYFVEHDDKNNIVGRVKDKDNIIGKDKKIKYLIIIFTSEYQKLMYTKIF